MNEVLTFNNYGLSNLGYLLIAASIFKGKFLIFGLNSRLKVIIFGIISLGLGTLLQNIPFSLPLLKITRLIIGIIFSFQGFFLFICS